MESPGGMEHPGILHLYCHLMELSHEPMKAMSAANALRTLFPLAGHLTHMASHIDIWAGHYKVRRRFGSARNVLPTVLIWRVFEYTSPRDIGIRPWLGHV